ncbi:MAG: hypothetical protein RLZZ347_641 [Candidatus Parcubacteria bacterium]|jgi:RNA polymerase-binding transcription factor DksA
MNTDHFKKLLETELIKVEGELTSVGRRNPNNPNDWEATPKAFQADSADRMEVADSIDDYEDNTAILKDLEIRYNEIKKALERIKKNAYGICAVCKKPIDPKRLEANPAADTCVAHSK